MKKLGLNWTRVGPASGRCEISIYRRGLKEQPHLERRGAAAIVEVRLIAIDAGNVRRQGSVRARKDPGNWIAIPRLGEHFGIFHRSRIGERVAFSGKALGHVDGVTMKASLHAKPGGFVDLG